MIPARGKLLVKRVSTEERASGSRIIIPESAREALAAYQMIVVSVGEPEYCDDEEDCAQTHVPTRGRVLGRVKIGPDDYEEIRSCTRTVVHPTDNRLVPQAWILTTPRSLVESDTPDHYLINQSDVQAVFTEY